MEASAFQTTAGRTVPAVTADEMAEVDRVATDDVGLVLLMMMENAGRNLARVVARTDPETVTVVAGSGGNGGGGMACARHLANRGVEVSVALSSPPPESLAGAPAQQFAVLDAMGVPVVEEPDPAATVVVDALVGYGLDGVIRGAAVESIAAMNDAERVVSLDVPSGIDATSGEVLGRAVDPEVTVTLALPKTGLRGLDTELWLADIAIPTVVYERAELTHDSPFDGYLEKIVAAD